jgi:hypothetical protein
MLFKLFHIFLLLLIKIAELNCLGRYNSSLNDYLYNSNVRINEWSQLLPKLVQEAKKNPNPWSAIDQPFWLRMANQALFLRNKKIKDEKKLVIKIDFTKKIPFIREFTNKCLKNPWYNKVYCNFKQIKSNIEVMCLMEGVENMLFNDLSNRKSISYRYFCWIVYAINYVEQCQISLLTDETNCSLNSIELMIKLVLQKINNIITFENNDILKYTAKFYSRLFKERAMQILIQILLLFNDNMNSFNNEVNIDKLNAKLEIKLHLEKLLDYLLNDYVEFVLDKDIDFKLKKKDEKFHVISNLISKKIKSLTEYSIRVILKHIYYEIKYLN